MRLGRILAKRQVGLHRDAYGMTRRLRNLLTKALLFYTKDQWRAAMGKAKAAAEEPTPPPDRTDAEDTKIRLVGCEHKQALEAVSFDKDAAAGLTAYEVRKRWPRYSGICPECRCPLIGYASTEHYLAGDW